MDVKNVKAEKKVLEAKIIKLIGDFEDNTNTVVSEISIKRYDAIGMMSIIDLKAKVNV